MQKIDREAKITRARELFLSGYNCAQSVFAAYAEEAGLTESLALRLSSGFGGGMGGLRSVCGAVSGMFMVVSALRGYDDAADTRGEKAPLCEGTGHGGPLCPRPMRCWTAGTC